MTGKRASPVVQSRVPSRARLLVGLAALLGLLLLGLRRLPAPEAGPAKLGSQTNSAEPGWLLLAGFEQSSELDEEPKQGQIETSTANETSKSFKQLDEQPATLEQRPEVRPRPRRLAPDRKCRATKGRKVCSGRKQSRRPFPPMELYFWLCKI